MLPINNQRLINLVLLGGIVIMIATYGVTKYQRSLDEVRNIAARSRLAQLRHAMSNYESIQHRRLSRVRTDPDGRQIGWREEIAPYFDDQTMHEIAAAPHRAAEFRQTTSKGPAPMNLRLPFDKSDPDFTSLIGVYEDAISDAATGDDAPWAIVAVMNTKIRWNEPKDLSVQEFVNLLDAPNAAMRPLAILTANGQLGRIDQTMIGFSILSPGQPPVESFS